MLLTMRIIRPALGLIGDDGVTSASTIDVFRPTALLPQPVWPVLYHMVSSVLAFLLGFPLAPKKSHTQISIVCIALIYFNENLTRDKIINGGNCEFSFFCRDAVLLVIKNECLCVGGKWSKLVLLSRFFQSTSDFESV